MCGQSRRMGAQMGALVAPPSTINSIAVMHDERPTFASSPRESGTWILGADERRERSPVEAFQLRSPSVANLIRPFRIGEQRAPDCDDVELAPCHPLLQL